MGRREARQAPMWISGRELARSPGHRFYEKLNELLAEAKFDREVERICAPYFEGDDQAGRRSIPPFGFAGSLGLGLASADRVRSTVIKSAPSPHLPTASVRPSLSLPDSPPASTLSATTTSTAAALQHAVDAHFEPLWRFARRLGVREPDVDDVLQEVIMVLAQRAVATVALPWSARRVAPRVTAAHSSPVVGQASRVPLAAPPAEPRPAAAPEPSASPLALGSPLAAAPATKAPPSPHAAPSRAEGLATPASTSLGEEVAALGRAHQALESGNPGEALRLIDGFFSQIHEPLLKPEADALRIEALAALGDRAGARSFLRSFREAHPDSPLLEHLEAVTDR